MSVDILNELKQKHISVTIENGKLKYSGPSEHLSQDLISKIHANKRILLKHFWPKGCINLMPIQVEGTEQPLTIIHAGPSNYPISRVLGKERPFFGYFYIGSEGEKTRYKNLETFAAEYLRQLLIVQPNGPYYIGGMSFGGHLAYEMAVQLEKQGKEVPLVFIIDAALNDDPKYLPKESLYRRSYNIVKSIYYFFYDLSWRIIFSTIEVIFKKIPKDKRNKYIRWTYKEYIKKYQPEHRVKGKIIVMRASQNRSKYPLLGWERVSDNIELFPYEGNHGSMYNNPTSVEIINEKIKQSINDYENNKTRVVSG